jgi:hypothetical protein
VIGAARFERGEPPAETGELIGRQLGNGLGDFFDFHVAHYSRIYREALDVDAGRTGLATVVGKRIEDVSADAVRFLVLRRITLERLSTLIGTSLLMVTRLRGGRKLARACDIIVSEALMRSTRRSMEVSIAKFGGGGVPSCSCAHLSSARDKS